MVTWSSNCQSSWECTWAHP